MGATAKTAGNAGGFFMHRALVVTISRTKGPNAGISTAKQEFPRRPRETVETRTYVLADYSCLYEMAYRTPGA